MRGGREEGDLPNGERRAIAQTDYESAGHRRGTMSILNESREADKRKYAELRRGLLDRGFRS